MLATFRGIKLGGWHQEILQHYQLSIINGLIAANELQFNCAAPLRFSCKILNPPPPPKLSRFLPVCRWEKNRASDCGCFDRDVSTFSYLNSAFPDMWCHYLQVDKTIFFLSKKEAGIKWCVCWLEYFETGSANYKSKVWAAERCKFYQCKGICPKRGRLWLKGSWRRPILLIEVDTKEREAALFLFQSL